jgi:ferredoxin
MARLGVEIIRELCAGYANCLDVAPDVFDLDEHDIAVVRNHDYSVDQRERLEHAARRCPAKAIVVNEI